MTHSAQKHVIDRLADWIGPLIFASGMGFAALTAGGAIAAAVALVVTLAASHWMMTRVDRRPSDARHFSPVELDFPQASDEGHEPATGELLLDDPLIVADNSRVVRLFAADDVTPAALVARIEDYLDRDPNRRDRGHGVRRDEPVPDASASLHAALANIRASLR